MSITPTQTLEGHAQNISAVTFHPELPIILTGSEDGTFRVWHANTYRFVAWLLDELSAVFDVLPICSSSSSFHLPLLFIFPHSRLESTLNYGLERGWCIAVQKGSNNVALGYDEGSVLIKLGREEPAMSMDSSGKIVWAKHSELQQVLTIKCNKRGLITT